ncbi:MAG: pyridoxamine 5'-phosphate oxidase family protein [Beijerinckiaceae bacterium]|nr:pyridoxamine 5'-phosphate oxidase family protein [Beijerinckiaceae bacterium]
MDAIGDELARFIARQHLFFVATAPDERDAHINLSPKGIDCFRVLDPARVAYLDLTGSGIETVAHLRQNGRIVIMFCAFEGAPKIVRLYGRGRVVEPGDAEWDGLRGRFPAHEGARAVIVVEVGRVASSCGYGVPLYEYQGERTQLIAYAENKGPAGIKTYQAKNNRRSIDGLPGLRSLAEE